VVGNITLFLKGTSSALLAGNANSSRGVSCLSNPSHSSSLSYGMCSVIGVIVVLEYLPLGLHHFEFLEPVHVESAMVTGH